MGRPAIFEHRPYPYRGNRQIPEKMAFRLKQCTTPKKEPTERLQGATEATPVHRPHSRTASILRPHSLIFDAQKARLKHKIQSPRASWRSRLVCTVFVWFSLGPCCAAPTRKTRRKARYAQRAYTYARYAHMRVNARSRGRPQTHA